MRGPSRNKEPVESDAPNLAQRPYRESASNCMKPGSRKLELQPAHKTHFPSTGPGEPENHHRFISPNEIQPEGVKGIHLAADFRHHGRSKKMSSVMAIGCFAGKGGASGTSARAILPPSVSAAVSTFRRIVRFPVMRHNEFATRAPEGIGGSGGQVPKKRKVAR